MYRSTKTYGHEVGLSCAFRQWRAQSHCSKIHGYALSVKVVFKSEQLDFRNWVVDFGSLKSFKTFLEDTFDHKLIVAEDDPDIEKIRELGLLSIADLVIVENTGCEAFSHIIYEYAEMWLVDNGYSPRVSIESVEVREHGANSAVFTKELS